MWISTGNTRINLDQVQRLVVVQEGGSWTVAVYIASNGNPLYIGNYATQAEAVTKLAEIDGAFSQLREV